MTTPRTRRIALHGALRFVAAGLVLAAAACAPAYRGAAIDGVVDVGDPLVAAGERAFARHCHACHPNASAALGPAITPFAPIVRLQVRWGLGAMPAFDPDRLPDDELDAIVAYLDSLRRHSAIPRAR